jgi:hypothetical protein
MGASRTRLLAVAASLAIATSSLGSIAPAIAEPLTTVTNDQVTEPANLPAPTASTSIETKTPEEPSAVPAGTIAASTTASETAPVVSPSTATSTAPPATPARLQTEAAAGGAVSTGQAVLSQLPLTNNLASGYDRSYFTHWIDENGDGCDTRAEVLKAESLVPVTFSSGCTVATGQWYSWYDGATWTQASDVDIDHMIPLSEAWKSGASNWTADQRTAFANDLGYGHALEAVTDNVNQSKSDQDPATWMSSLDQCQYAIAWVTQKWRWNLAVDDSERSMLGTHLNGTECGTTTVGLPAKMIVGSPATELWPLAKIVYDSTIYELVTNQDGSQTPVPLSYEKWRDVYSFRDAAPAPTDFVKYPWSPTVYAVTFWTGGENAWMWTPLSYQQWATAHMPTPRNAGWIKGAYYYKWGSSAELFVEGADGVNHKLTGAEWAASGYRSYVDRGSEGYLKLTWAPEFARMSNLSTGAGRPMGYNEWQEEGFPTPQAVQRITGDKFYKDCGSSTIWYAGPGMNRPVSLQEWQGAGSPSPTVTGTCGGPTPPPSGGGTPPPSQPGNPGDTKNCTDFSTEAQAQAWFNTYYPYYGDVAKLDGNNDGRACESLP